MMRLKRPKVIRKKLEIDLFKLEKRIQKLAAQAYQIRQMLADLTPEEQPVTAINVVPEATNALHNEGSEGEVRGWTADPNTGESQLLDNIVAAAILPEQPEKLSVDQ